MVSAVGAPKAGGASDRRRVSLDGRDRVVPAVAGAAVAVAAGWPSSKRSGQVYDPENKLCE